MMSKLRKINVLIIGLIAILILLQISLVYLYIVSGNYIIASVWAFCALIYYISGAGWIDTYFKTLKEEKEIKAIQEEIAVLNAILNGIGKKQIQE